MSRHHFIRQNFSRAAAQYDAAAEFQHTQTQRLFDRARENLPAHAHILDIGCGTGSFARLAQLSQAHWRVTGVDIAEGMAQHAQHFSHAVVGDSVALPFANASFDAIVSSLCLQWVSPLAAAFQEIARVLKPSGRAILIMLAGETLQELHSTCAALHMPLSLLPMQPVASYLDAVRAANLQLQHQEAPVILRHYPSARAMLDLMRRIGASYRQENRRISVSEMKRFLALYETNYRDEYGVFASWQPLLIEVIKPS